MFFGEEDEDVNDDKHKDAIEERAIIKDQHVNVSSRIKFCLKSVFKIGFDEAVNLTSEKHDPCARTVTYKRRKQEHLTEGAGVEPAKYPPKVKLEIYSHNSRALENGRLCVP